MQFNRLVLPAPFGPMMATSSPCANAEIDLVEGCDAAETESEVLHLQLGPSFFGPGGGEDTRFTAKGFHLYDFNLFFSWCPEAGKQAYMSDLR